ncbi:MAG TPA: hypothetical protein VK211_18675 [Kamptonema sp.]|nr:hypothetical protein [Kamptonema sp.]
MRDCSRAAAKPFSLAKWFDASYERNLLTGLAIYVGRSLWCRG